MSLCFSLSTGKILNGKGDFWSIETLFIFIYKFHKTLHSSTLNLLVRIFCISSLYLENSRFLDFQVIMADKEAADRALKEPNPIIDGRKANVNLAILGAKPRGNLTGMKQIINLYYMQHKNGGEGGSGECTKHIL